MLRVGLTGGIGSGKSTIAAMFKAHGAHIIDADQIARDIVLPGAAAIDDLVAAFGPTIKAEDGSLVRPELARIAFQTPELTQQMNDIIFALLQQKQLVMQSSSMTSRCSPKWVQILFRWRLWWMFQ